MEADIGESVVTDPRPMPLIVDEDLQQVGILKDSSRETLYRFHFGPDGNEETGGADGAPPSGRESIIEIPPQMGGKYEFYSERARKILDPSDRYVEFDTTSYGECHAFRELYEDAAGHPVNDDHGEYGDPKEFKALIDRIAEMPNTSYSISGPRTQALQAIRSHILSAIGSGLVFDDVRCLTDHPDAVCIPHPLSDGREEPQEDGEDGEDWVDEDDTHPGRVDPEPTRESAAHPDPSLADDPRYFRAWLRRGCVHEILDTYAVEWVGVYSEAKIRGMDPDTRRTNRDGERIRLVEFTLAHPNL